VNNTVPRSFTEVSSAPIPPARPVPPVVTGYTSKPKHSWHHPDLYTHEDELIYPQFQGGLEAKLQINKLAIGHEEEKV
jgi:hypothetical protein